VYFTKVYLKNLDCGFRIAAIVWIRGSEMNNHVNSRYKKR